MRSVGTGNLALSRAIGDFEFKKDASLPPEEQIITANPEVIEHEIGEDEEFIVIACDGASLLMSATLMNKRSHSPFQEYGIACHRNKWWTSSVSKSRRVKNSKRSPLSCATTASHLVRLPAQGSDVTT